MDNIPQAVLRGSPPIHRRMKQDVQYQSQPRIHQDCSFSSVDP